MGLSSCSHFFMEQSCLLVLHCKIDAELFIQLCNIHVLLLNLGVMQLLALSPKQMAPCSFVMKV